MAAVLDGEAALGAESACPQKQLLVPARVAAHRLLGERPPARSVDGHSGVGLHMRVDSDYDHFSPPWSVAADL